MNCIWIADKGKEGWCVQVHGTSNILNEFFPTGICVTSEELAKNYSGKPIRKENCQEKTNICDEWSKALPLS